MTSMTWPDHLLTLDDWDELPEDASRRFELVDGVLQMSPKPTPAHQRAGMRLAIQLDRQLASPGLECVPDIDLAIVERFPPLVRAPDLVVTTPDALTARPDRLATRDVVLAVEIVSPGSARVDRVAKLAEYAEAGISHYWLVDLGTRTTIDAFDLDGATYRPVMTGAVGTVRFTAPAPMTIDLDALVPKNRVSGEVAPS
jgi:Uma2 family endonuclease